MSKLILSVLIVVLLARFTARVLTAKALVDFVSGDFAWDGGFYRLGVCPKCFPVRRHGSPYSLWYGSL
ncbi:MULTISPECIES: hypothetical protein [Burkholderiaceae]|uniref:Uncharacterized protein n=1 Tax=Caballeronia sordidicola TaxID=196367 RepID=A0A242M7N3_CABSO|nr:MULTISPECIES: hypothetical protein [Burkholderiaceae]MDP9154475.1 hypothetical protein [Pseudomonadota bacterium]OTP66635.1 hypothetical protein PAMC26510_32905 [Caballeronia sordidicola]OTP69130.1 hypothetical protein PAMC26577_31530 [Caballeronia sordidicola]